MNSSFTGLDALKNQWVEAQPLSSVNKERLWRKYRLEWNYNSNHIEGNTLTYAETELLLIQGETKGDHTIREYDEMKAHDLAISHILDLADSNEPINESDVRNLNSIILKEPFWKEAVTEAGQPTRAQVIPGNYKTLPNNVRTVTGDYVHFTPPMDTPSKVADLIAWLRKELAAPTLHPIALAAKLHHEFLVIHPFDDGNGRVARLLANYVLLRNNFTPLIVKSADKPNYIAALRRADVGEYEALVNYFTKEEKWSLEIAISAANGKPIEEPNDIDKEIALFITTQNAAANSMPFNRTTAAQLFQGNWALLFRRFEERLRVLEPLFMEVQCRAISTYYTFPEELAKVFIQYLLPPLPSSLPERKTQTPNSASALKRDDDAVIKSVEKVLPNKNFDVSIFLRGYKSDSIDPFNIRCTLTLQFEEFRYIIKNGDANMCTKLFGLELTKYEIEDIAEKMLKEVFADIRRRVNGTSGSNSKGAHLL